VQVQLQAAHCWDEPWQLEPLRLQHLPDAAQARAEAKPGKPYRCSLLAQTDTPALTTLDPELQLLKGRLQSNTTK
jgi:hypothetical protein